MLYSDNLFETDQWVEMIQVNECGLRESLGKKKEVFNGGTSLFWEDCECVNGGVEESTVGGLTTDHERKRRLEIYTQLYVTATEK